jgi:L-malate glycosyltransferase
MPSAAARIRVLHVLPWVTSGGVERRRLELARGLGADEFEQRVVCLEARETLAAEFARAGVDVLPIGGTGSLADLKSMARVVRVAREFAPHVIHGAVFEGVTLASTAGRLAGVRRVVVEEISDGENRSGRARQLFRLYALAASRCVAVSEYAKQQLVETGIPAGRIQVIVNGVSAPACHSEAALEEARARWGISADDLVVVTIGRLLNEHKRFTDLIEAVALALPQAPRLKLLVVGGGGELESLRQHAARHGVEQRVSFAGYQPDVSLPLRLGQMFALTSSRESFGLVAVEAMLASLPVVATAVGGLREIVADGQTGFLVPPFAPAQVAKALLRLGQDESLRTRLGAAGRERAEQRFSAARYVEEVAALYRHLVGSTRKQSA